MSENWLNTLKVGDKVIISFDLNDQYVDVVERLTKTQIILKKAYFQRQYRRDTGRLVGGCSRRRNNYPCLLEATEERIAVIAEKTTRIKLINSIEKCKLHTLNTDVLQQIERLMSGHKDLRQLQVYFNMTAEELAKKLD